MSEKLLLLEDDISLADGLIWSLKRNGFEVEHARTVARAMTLLAHTHFDLLLLDVTLPDGTGFEVCSHVRRRQDPVPVIFLTALDEEVNVIRGLEGGGDDYITKPFRLGELCSRIRAQLRRAKLSCARTETILECGPFSVDLLSGRVTVMEKEDPARSVRTLDLTGAEYRLLCLLLKNAGCIVTRDAILREIWDEGGSFVDDNTLSVYIRRLREKVEKEPSRPAHLLTVRGFGYRWEV